MSQSQKPNIEKELTTHIGQELICPDGETRTLKTFESGKNGVTALWWKEGGFKEIANVHFWNEWPAYRLKDDPDAPVTAVQLAQVSLTPEMQRTEMQATALIDTGDVTKMLFDQMQKVRSNSSAIPQAKVMADLAKQIIEANKLKLEALKLVHAVNKKD